MAHPAHEKPSLTSSMAMRSHGAPPGTSTRCQKRRAATCDFLDGSMRFITACSLRNHHGFEILSGGTGPADRARPSEVRALQISGRFQDLLLTEDKVLGEIRRSRRRRGVAADG